MSTTPAPTTTDEAQETVTAWSTIYVPLVISVAQGLILYIFYICQRRKDKNANKFDLYEPRQFTREHRSPTPFSDGNWMKEAWSISDDDFLKYVGLDSYMFIRFVRLSVRATALGSFFAIILMPIYGTGDATGEATEQFNIITMAHLEQGDVLLWVPAVCWFLFIGFILRDLWNEWMNYSTRRKDFLAKGDVDTEPDYRYAVLIENVPKELQSNGALRTYLERIFPNKVRQVHLCLNTNNLTKLIDERQKCIVAYEKADAFKHAKPDKPDPQVKEGGKCGGCCGGTKVDAMPFYEKEIERLNAEIDDERRTLWELAEQDQQKAVNSNLDTTLGATFSADDDNKAKDGAEDNVELTWGSTSSKKNTTSSTPDEQSEADEEGLIASNKADDNKVTDVDGDDGDDEDKKLRSSTAFVTFTSLVTKQVAVQCNMSGKADNMDLVAAPIPASVIWSNVTFPNMVQKVTNAQATAIWTLGILFWAFPVAFVTAIANINSVLDSLGLPTLDENTFYYGLLSGLLPPLALQILMIVLYIALGAVATHFIKLKSMSEVDNYVFFWHQLFQFANLWLILIGGSLFNQINAIVEDPSSFIDFIAKAMPGASTFFFNMISVQSFGTFGMEISQIVRYVIAIIMNKISPEPMCTQRMLDEGNKPPVVDWGMRLPYFVFFFFVAVVYMPIVPLLSIHSFVFFGLAYLVWKHQCLHVYAQEFEGGGVIWETLFTFMISSLYMAEIIFFGYLGVKQSPATVLGIIPLILTIIAHLLINRNIRAPLRTLALEVAATVDIDEGEMEVLLDDKDSVGGTSSYEKTIEGQLYGQPSLKPSLDERAPMQYRRNVGDDTDDNMETGVGGLSAAAQETAEEATA